MTTTSDNASIVTGLCDFIDAVVIPLEEEYRADVTDPWLLYQSNGAYSERVREVLQRVRQESAKAGYYAMFAPQEIGGGGCGPDLLYEVWREVHARYGPGRLLPVAAVAHWSYGPSFLYERMSHEMRTELLGGLMDGTLTSCFAMSEPDAGSDGWAMSTRARLEDDEWVINGTKQWITNSPEADCVFVWAVTNNDLRRERRGGISCFVVPSDTPGCSVDSVISLFGQNGGHEGIVSFTDVRVPRGALVGEIDRGFILAMEGVSTGRLYNAARCVGMAQWAIDQASQYAGDRQAFGQRIGDYQGVSFQLADCAVEVYAADMMSRDCAQRLADGRWSDDHVAMVKIFTTETCFRVYDRCMQVLGGMGLTNEMRLTAGWHQARIVRIADGSAEILRRNVGRALVKGRLKAKEL